MIQSSAPGKIVVSGEYAVLGGAPAIAMAVDRRVAVSLLPAEQGSWQLQTPGFLEGCWAFALQNGRVEWRHPAPPDGAMRLIECVMERVSSATPASSIRIDSSAFHCREDGAKLGLGSSAAVAVALTAALVRDASPDDLIDIAGRAHAAFQGGRGSGIDIATSVSGGLVAYARGRSPGNLSWPRELDCAVLWSGRPSSTADRIGSIDLQSAGFRELAAAATGTAAVWASGPASRALDALADFAAALAAFDQQKHLGIFAAGHDDLYRMATSYDDLVYKPCGAGGGDVGIAVARSRNALADFCRRAEAAGFSLLDAALDPRGVTVS
ncbi:MAG: hypothetical protein R3315_07770 [Woeseiaceae bacterium]|nr:hypothetical protein [Woeseiaceae bacterium]